MNETFKAPYITYKDALSYWRVKDGLGNLVARDLYEDEAQELAKVLNEHTEQAARIAELEARVKELEERLGQMTDEFRMDDHNLHYPRCNCQSHQNYHAARALLETK